MMKKVTVKELTGDQYVMTVTLGTQQFSVGFFGEQMECSGVTLDHIISSIKGISFECHWSLLGECKVSLEFVKVHWGGERHIFHFFYI